MVFRVLWCAYKYWFFFSLSCVFLCFSSNYVLLQIARSNEHIKEKPIPVAFLPTAWVRLFACWDWGWNPIEGVEVCLFCMLFVVRCRSQSLINRPQDSTECAVSGCYLETLRKEKPCPEYGPKRYRKKMNLKKDALYMENMLIATFLLTFELNKSKQTTVLQT